MVLFGLFLVTAVAAEVRLAVVQVTDAEQVDAPEAIVQKVTLRVPVGAAVFTTCISFIAVAPSLSIAVRRKTYVPEVFIPVIFVVSEFGLDIEYEEGPEILVQATLAIEPSESLAVPVTETELAGGAMFLSTPADTVGGTLAKHELPFHLVPPVQLEVAVLVSSTAPPFFKSKIVEGCETHTCRAVDLLARVESVDPVFLSTNAGEVA